MNISKAVPIPTLLSDVDVVEAALVVVLCVVVVLVVLF